MATDPTTSAVSKVTITWSLKDIYRLTFDLSKAEDREELIRLSQADWDVDDQGLLLALQQMDDDPYDETAEAFAEMSTQATWFDRDPGDCVRINDVQAT